MKRSRLVGVLLLIGLLLAACSAPAEVEPTAVPEQEAPAESEPTVTPTSESSPTPEEKESEEEVYPLPTTETQEEVQSPTAYPDSEEESEVAVWRADGDVTDGEYDNVIDIDKMRLWWSNDADYLYLALRGDTEGWIGVGLDPEDRMQGANYLICAVTDEGATVWDAYGEGAVGATHPPDEELGGSDDVVAFGASEADGVTVMEAQIPLDSGDEYDKVLEPGETYPVIVALGASDEYDASHTYRGQGEITLAAVE